MSRSQKAIVIIVVVFLISNASFLVVTIMADAGNLKQMVQLARYISYMKYAFLANIMLLIALILIYQFKVNKFKKVSRQQEEKNVMLQSSIYDNQNKQESQ